MGPDAEQPREGLCPACGAALSIGHEDTVCPRCGFELLDAAPRQPAPAQPAQLKPAPWHGAPPAMCCQSCGFVARYPQNAPLVCPSCAGAQLRKAPQCPAYDAPEVIFPFRVSPRSARRLAAWWFLFSGIRPRRGDDIRLIKLYRPYYRIRFVMQSHFRAWQGDAYTQKQRSSEVYKGRLYQTRETQTHHKWTRIHGTGPHMPFEELLCAGSASMDLIPFMQAPGRSLTFLPHDCPIEQRAFGAEQALERSQENAHSRAAAAILEQVSGSIALDSLRQRLSFSNVRVQCTLYPVYMAQYIRGGAALRRCAVSGSALRAGNAAEPPRRGAVLLWAIVWLCLVSWALALLQNLL